MKMLYRVAFAMLLVAGGTVQAAEYAIDLAHSQVGFKVKHLTISSVPGRFDVFSGSVAVEPGKPETLTGEAVVEARSVNTNSEKRDEHLRNPDFFNVEKFPTLSYKIAKVRPQEDGSLQIVGELTMLGVTKVVILKGELAGPIDDPQGNERIGLAATGVLNRRDFGMTYGDDKMVSDNVILEIDLEAMRKKE